MYQEIVTMYSKIGTFGVDYGKNVTDIITEITHKIIAHLPRKTKKCQNHIINLAYTLWSSLSRRIKT